MYNRLKDRQATLDKLLNVAFLTNARTTRVGQSGSEGDAYSRDQIEMRRYVRSIKDDTTRSKLEELFNGRHSEFVRAGAGPRGFLKLIPAALCHAFLEGHETVEDSDIMAVSVPVLRHRMHMDVHARLAGVTADDVVTTIAAELCGRKD